MDLPPGGGRVGDGALVRSYPPNDKVRWRSSVAGFYPVQACDRRPVYFLATRRLRERHAQTRFRSARFSMRRRSPGTDSVSTVFESREDFGVNT